MRTNILLFTILLFTLPSCVHVNYVGKTYSPTNEIDIHFSASGVENEYEVIGHAISAGQLFVSVDDLKHELIKEAKVNGADAIIITDINRDNEEDGAGFDAEKQVKATFIIFK